MSFILGYTPEKIKQLETYGDSVHCCQTMLQTWANSKRNTSLGVLLKALSHIGRYDIVKVLQADLRGSQTDHNHVHIV